MVAVGAGGQVSAQTHSDGPGGDLGQSGNHDDAGVRDRAGKSGGQRERHRQAVGHADHHVAHGIGSLEVLFHMWSRWHKET